MAGMLCCCLRAGRSLGQARSLGLAVLLVCGQGCGRALGTCTPGSSAGPCAGTEGGLAIGCVDSAERDGLLACPVVHSSAGAVFLPLSACPSLTPSPLCGRAVVCLAVPSPSVGAGTLWGRCREGGSGCRAPCTSGTSPSPAAGPRSSCARAVATRWPRPPCWELRCPWQVPTGPFPVLQAQTRWVLKSLVFPLCWLPILLLDCSQGSPAPMGTPSHDGRGAGAWLWGQSHPNATVG